MNRRGFLGLLAGAALDPERLLWMPGRKLISIPKFTTPLMDFTNLSTGQPLTIEAVREALKIMAAQRDQPWRIDPAMIWRRAL